MAKKSLASSLEAALKATKPRDLFTALAEAWVTLPAVELAELNALAATQAPPPAWDDTDGWVEAAASKKTELRPALVASLKGGSVADAGVRFDAVARWKADPSLANALIALLENPPWTSSGSRPTWTRLFTLVSQQHDARFVALSKTLPATWGIRADQKEWLTRAFTRAVAELPTEVPPLPADVRPLVEQLRAKLGAAAPPTPPPKAGAKTEADLLAMIYAHPADDGPRLVYADFLTERGDPRGEFISSQLSKSRTAEQLATEKALLKKHGKAWLGPLAPLLGADFEFRRGFVAKGLVKFKHLQHAKEHAAHPEWATLEEAEWSGAGSENQIAGTRFLAPAFRHLKRASGAWLPGVLEAKDVTWALEHLDGFVDDPQVVRKLLESEQLPALRSLGVACAELRPEVLAVKTRVERVAVLQRPKESLIVFLAAAEKTTLREFDWGPYAFRRGADGRFSTLGLSELELRSSWMGTSLRSGRDALLLLPAGCLDTLEQPLIDALNESKLESVVAELTRLVRRDGAKPASLSSVAAKALGFDHVTGVAVESTPWVVAGEGEVKLVDPKTHEVTATLVLCEEGRNSALARNGRWYATVEGEALRVFSLPDGKLARTLELPDSVYSVALSPTGSHAIVTFRKKPAHLFELASGRVVATFEGWSPAFDGAGKQVALSKREAVVVRGLDGGEVRAELPLPGLEPRAKCFVSDDVVAVHCHFKGVRLLDFAKQKVVRHDEDLRADWLQVDPTGTTLLMGQGTMVGPQLLDAKTLAKRGTLPEPSLEASHHYLPDGQILRVTKAGVSLVPLDEVKKKKR